MAVTAPKGIDCFLSWQLTGFPEASLSQISTTLATEPLATGVTAVLKSF